MQKRTVEPCIVKKREELQLCDVLDEVLAENVFYTACVEGQPFACVVLQKQLPLGQPRDMPFFAYIGCHAASTDVHQHLNINVQPRWRL